MTMMFEDIPIEWNWGPDLCHLEVRMAQVQLSGQFGLLYTDEATGERRSYVSLVPVALEATESYEKELPGYAKRARIRRALADKIEHEVLPIVREDRPSLDELEKRELARERAKVNRRRYRNPRGTYRYLSDIPQKLRNARTSGCFGINLETGKGITYWDDKAGLARLCPDDAREEAQRLRRRIEPVMLAALDQGAQLTYSVFTMPNVEAGQLANGCRKIMRDFRNRILRKRRPKKDGGGLYFPQIIGAECVLEAPLSCHRDWNIHLNVILITRGFVQWGELRKAWHWNVEFQRIRDGDGVRTALAELIKYSVQATAEKSAEKYTATSDAECADGAAGDTHSRRSPPPMLEWRPAELLEWLLAMRGFRRTRGYGCLHGIKAPESDGLGQIVWIGRVRYQGGVFRLLSSLLDSIPEDKSPTGEKRSHAERWRIFLKRTVPRPGEVGALITAHFPALCEMKDRYLA